MSMFTLAISCLTTSNLPWFMDLTSQVPMHYRFSQHQTLLLPSDTSTAGLHFCFGSISLFFLELFLYTSPVAYWIPTNPGRSSSGVISFCLFVLFMGFLRQLYWSGLPFPSPVDHILSELSTMTHSSWVPLHGMAYSFIELHKAVVHAIILVSFLFGGHGIVVLASSFFPLKVRIRGLCKQASWWEGLAVGKTGSSSGGHGHAQ